MLPARDALVIALDGGAVARYDIGARSGAVGRVRDGAAPTALEAVSDAEALVAWDDGCVAMLDTRAACAPAQGVRLGPFRDVANIAVWPNGRACAAVACRRGAVTIVDLRMWMAVAGEKTRPITQVLPMAIDESGLSYLLFNEEEAEVVVAAGNGRPRTSTVYKEAGCFRRAVSFLGGAVIVDDVGASFLHARGAPICRLFDRECEALERDGAGGSWNIRKSPAHGPSVHKHEGVVVCGTVVKDVIVTCDDLGFINQWKIEHYL
jgi:hypothetical protein